MLKYSETKDIFLLWILQNDSKVEICEFFLTKLHWFLLPPAAAFQNGKGLCEGNPVSAHLWCYDTMFWIALGRWG